MEMLEFVLLLLAAVLVSAVLDQVTPRVSLPLVQIALGAVIILLVGTPVDVAIDPELFLVLFIAPLLFDESRHASKRGLWDNKGAIVSLAVGLVLATVLVVGFVLNWLEPSIPLAAAFALGAALGPTDAVAVSALGKDIHLSSRQKSLLSGEALINDASGVVSFQFAIAAAITGSFSLANAAQSFAISFFGGIAVGLVVGLLAVLALGAIRSYGYESITVHVVFEVFTPFITFLAAEHFGTSGILAVVAAGLSRMQIICTAYFLCGIMDTLASCLRGRGYSVIPMIVSLVGSCLLRLVWIATIFRMFRSTGTLYISYPLSWALTAGVHLICLLVVRKKMNDQLKEERHLAA